MRGPWTAAIALLVIAPIPARSQDTLRLEAATASLDEGFTRIQSVRELPDGRVLILDEGENRVVVADLEKQRVQPISRVGDGPGEYGRARQLIPVGRDSTYLTSPKNARWLVLVGADVTETLSYATAPSIVRIFGLIRGVDGSGRVLHTLPLPSSFPTRIPDVLNTDAIALATAHMRTRRVDTLAKLHGRVLGPSNEIPKTTRFGTAVFNLRSPFGVEDQAWLFPDGWVVIIRVDPYGAEWIDPEGRSKVRARIPNTPLETTEEEKRFAARLEMVDKLEPPFPTSDYPNWPATVPPIDNDALFPLNDGRIVLERRLTARATARTYDVVDRLGKLVATLALPIGSRIIGFGNKTVYVVTTDGDDLQHIARHPLPDF